MVARTTWLPNLRRLIIPDPGYEFASPDLAGADAQVVAWDSGARLLKEGFRSGMKIHAFNSIQMNGERVAGSDGRNEPYYTLCKVNCHAFNYFGQPKGVAAKSGQTVHEAEQFRHRWFQMNPEIPRWHKKVNNQLLFNQTITNAFGYTITYRDRYKPTSADGMSPLLPKALAWIGQGTVAFVTQFALNNLSSPEFRQAFQWVKLSLQIHDEILMQWLISQRHRRHELLPFINITVPYADPLVIPWSLKTSPVSWGDCKDETWGEAGDKTQM